MDLSDTLYIAHLRQDFENLSWVHKLHEDGVKWILLDVSETEFYEIHPEKHFLAFLHEKADQLKMICDALEMKFSVSEALEVALFSGADGIHFREREGLEQIRLQHPDLIIGLSLSEELDAAVLINCTESVDYLLVGKSLPGNMEIVSRTKLDCAVYVQDKSPGCWKRIRN